MSGQRLSKLFLVYNSQQIMDMNERMCELCPIVWKDLKQYTEENIRSLDWKEHIRLRPGMYLGQVSLVEEEFLYHSILI